MFLLFPQVSRKLKVRIRTAIETITADMLQTFILNTNQRSKSLSVLNCNFSKEQFMLPEGDRMIETCRSVLSVLM